MSKRQIMKMRTFGAQLSPRSEQGFILPIVLGIGLIMTLLGVMMINRSMQNRVTATAQKETSQSSAAAEAGVAQFQSLLSRYPALSAHCSKTDLNSACNSKDWQNITDADLVPCVALATGASDRVKNYANDLANDEWQNLGDNPSEGQFRLVRYVYIPNALSNSPSHPLGTGELVVEGRINGTNTLNTSTTQLSVKFNFMNASGLANPPGLWIQSNQDTLASSSTQIKTNVRDSTCPDHPDIALATPLKNLQPQTYTYQLTPGAPFPTLPTEESYATTAGVGSGSYSISPISLRNAEIQKLPRAEDVAQNGIFIYSVDKDSRGRSIRLSSNSSLTIGNGNDTVILNLRGGFFMRDSSQIKLTSGSKLIVYSHGSVNLSSNSTAPLIEQAPGQNASTNVQIYVYPPEPSNPPHSVTIKSGVQMNLFLFAPESQVTFDADAKVKGAIWAKSWNSQSSSILEEDNINLSEINLIFPPRISTLTAWERR